MDILKEKKPKQPLDNPGIGFLTGFLMPLLIFFAIYIFKNRQIPLEEYLRNLWQMHALIKLFSLCVFANILIFMGFLKIKYERTARGVLGATILYALAILISKTFNF